MKGKSILTDEQRKAAQQLLNDRPAVFPGTRAILNHAHRKAWFDKVCREMKRLGVTSPRKTQAFCDIAGVPD